MVRTIAMILAAFSVAFAAVAQEDARKIVFLAGELDDHPRGTHEYEKSVTLLQHIIETSPNVEGVRTEAHFGGWPADPSTLDDADTIVVISGGSDQRLTDHPLMVDGRLEVIDRQMKRGCGLVAIHWTTFAPRDMAGEQFLEWIGGYFDYESGPPPRNWFSAIQTTTTTVGFPSPAHPVSHGLEPFELREEYYYRIRFRAGDSRLVPIMTTPIPGEDTEQVVAWAVEREDGGRGFGFTGGHFFSNFFIPGFRTMILNAILWSAKADVPEDGVNDAEGDAIRVLLLTGHNGPFHDWEAVTDALRVELTQDPRMEIEVAEDPERLAAGDLDQFDLIVQNYVNWERPGLSDEARQAFESFVRGGGGLAVIHFANGAFHFSLPGAAESNWPVYRDMVPRVWNHDGNSGHDPFGAFTVQIANPDHPITSGMSAFETVDELYFNQDGTAPIDVLATGRSKVTDRDEPLAFTHHYGGGRVFQTLLGHDADSVRIPGTATLIRRGAAWAAKRTPLAAQTP